jgi:hypothetical protein
MVGRYDEAIALCDSGGPLSPIFDDLAAARIVRAPLRALGPALKAGDTGKASTSWHAFKDHWSEAAPLFAARSSEAKQETDAALAALDTAMSAPTIDPALAGPLVDALLERYNYGVNLLNAAARNADLSKNTFTAEDIRADAALGALQKDLRDSLSNWQSGARSAAADSARTAANAHFESASPALQARGGADAAVKKALDAYTALADQASDRAQIDAANKLAIEAVAIGQQVLVGQFWTDPAFATAYQSAVRNT